MNWPTPPKVGDRVRRAAPPGKPGRLYHVRAIVDVEPDGTWQAVLRTWSPGRGWCYSVEGETAWHVGLYRTEEGASR